MPSIRFDNRVAIVTGAGSGIGRMHALELARRGCRVLVNDLGCSIRGEDNSTSAADEVVDQIHAQGGEAVANYSSVSTREGGSDIVQAALDHFGKVDILINNAGFVRNNRFEDLDDSQIDALVDVHLKASFYTTQPAYKVMRQNGYGRILFTGSGSSIYGHAWMANYAAAKAGLIGLNNVVALEGSAYGIQSNLFIPAAHSRQSMDPGFLEIPQFADTFRRIELDPIEHRLEPDFCTPLALYLVSEDCAASHGIYSAVAGTYARVGICAGEGWCSPANSAPTLEDIEANFESIHNLRRFSEPMTPYDNIIHITENGRAAGVLG